MELKAAPRAGSANAACALAWLAPGASPTGLEPDVTRETLKPHPHLFEPVDAEPPVEAATARPGDERP
jgi:hypothetical protein